MPKKILRRSRNQRNSLRLRALQTDEPEMACLTRERSTMMRIRGWLSLGTFLCGLITLLLGLATGCAGEEPTAASGPTAGPAGATPLDEAYQDPEAVSKHFSTELARLLKKEEVVSPADLADQAEEAKTCAVDTLPDPGEKLRPEEIYQGSANRRRTTAGRPIARRASCSARTGSSPPTTTW
jgi:hypothetical protein